MSTTVLIAQFTRMFAESLGTESVGPDEEYFTAGGTSAGFIDLVEAVRSAGYALTLRDALADPTPAGLAAAVARPS